LNGGRGKKIVWQYAVEFSRIDKIKTEKKKAAIISGLFFMLLKEGR